MRAPGLAALLSLCACSGASPPEPLLAPSASTEAAGEETAASDDPGVWIEQPREGEVGVDWPPAQSVLEVELDPSLSNAGAVVTLHVDDAQLWQGAYGEPLHVALPAGKHRAALSVVTRGAAARSEVAFESSRACRIRLTARGGHGAVRLEQRSSCGQ